MITSGRPLWYRLATIIECGLESGYETQKVAPQVGLELVRPIFASIVTAKWTLMAHCVRNDIHADLVCHDAVLGRKARVVDPLPGVAEFTLLNSGDRETLDTGKCVTSTENLTSSKVLYPRVRRRLYGHHHFIRRGVYDADVIRQAICGVQLSSVRGEGDTPRTLADWN